MKIGIFHADTNPFRGGGHVLKQELLQSFKNSHKSNGLHFLFFSWKETKLFQEIPSIHEKVVYRETFFYRLRFFIVGFLKRLLNFNFLRDISNLMQGKYLSYYKDCLKEANYKENRNASFESLLRNHHVDCFLFLEPGDVFITISPYVCINWDFAQFEDPYFPEFLPGWFLGSDIKLKATRKAMRVINGTKALSNQVHFHAQIPKERLRVLPFPTPSDALFYLKNPNKKTFLHFFENFKKPFLFYPASYWPHKNHALLIRSLKSLKEYGINYDLIFCGANKGNKLYLENLSSELHLEDQIHFLNFIDRENILEIYSRASALVFPSLVGPDNLPPLEAFAIGCPVIAGRLSGSEEQFGDAAYLFNPLIQDELTDAIKSLKNDQAGWEIRIQKGIKRAQSWTSKEYVEGVCEIFNELRPYIDCCDMSSYEIKFS